MLTTDPGSGARGHIIHTPLNFKKETRNRYKTNKTKWKSAMFFATLFWREPDLQIYNRAQ